MGETREAGRELDAEVAEKVMEYVWKRSAWTYGDPPRHARVLLPSRRAAAYMALQGDEGDCEAAESAPHFSADIAAAWDVVEKMRELKPHPFMLTLTNWSYYGDLSYRAVFTPPPFRGDPVEAIADTAPLAICRAALQAVDFARRSSRGGEDA